LSNGFGHLLQTVDSRGFRFFAPKQEGGAGQTPCRGDFANVAQVLFHEQGRSNVFKVEAEFLEFGGGIFRQLFFITLQQEALAFMNPLESKFRLLQHLRLFSQFKRLHNFLLLFFLAASILDAPSEVSIVLPSTVYFK
jgi:hypothetical protein